MACEMVEIGIQRNYPKLLEVAGFFASLRMTKRCARFNALTLQRLFEVLDRLLDPLLEFNSGFPTEDFFCAGDVRLAHLRVVHRQGVVFDCGFRPRDSDDFLCKLFNSHLARIAEVDWLVEIAHRKPENSIDQIGDVTK